MNVGGNSDTESDGVCDSDSEEIDWKPFSPTKSSTRDPPQSPSLTSSAPHVEDFQERDSDFSLNIPTSGFGFVTEEDLESDVERQTGGGGDEEDDEESIFLNPEMTPQEIKAMRLKKFGLNYQRSLSSQSPEKDPSLTASLRFGSEQKVHVGVALLDESDDDDDGDEEEDAPWTQPSRFSPQKRSEGRGGLTSSPENSSLSPHRHQQQYVNSPSATAWMHSKR